MYGIEGLLAGRTLVERYRIDAVVGRGGMGAVYRAHDTRLGREVAVKVIAVAVGDEQAHQRLRARFLREARAAAGLHHPNVVQVYDYGTDPELRLDFLVMELLRGEDLAARLNQKGSPAVATALEILYQAARGLAAGHRAGLVHRDVKPGNLFLEPGDRIGDVHVKVLDFGIADISTLGEETVTHLTVVGRSPYSPAYASPEQMRGEARLSPATDVFSLAAVGFHLLTGRRAFRASDPAQMVVELSAAVASELPAVRGLAPAARAVLQRALAPDPRERFPDAGAFATALEPLGTHPALERADEDRTVAAGPEPRRAPPPSWDLPVRESEPTGTRAYTSPSPRPGVADVTEFQERRPTPGPRPPPAPARPEAGWLRRTTRALWQLAVTAASIVTFGGAWYLVTAGLQSGDMEPVYGGAAAAVVGTPWAIHRLLRRPGSYRFALFASVAASSAVLLVLRGQRTEQVLAALFVVQVGTSLLAERLTRRREIDPLED